jgi:indoleamine 2,3-dioxygenase
MSYAAAYCLFNYTLDNPYKGLEYSNLRLIRSFEQGLNQKSSEAGFVLTHVDMVKESPTLVDATVRILNTLERGPDREAINEGLRDILRAMEKIELCMEGMLARLAQGQKGVVSCRDSRISWGRTTTDGRWPRHVEKFEAF